MVIQDLEPDAGLKVEARHAYRGFRCVGHMLDRIL